MGRGSSAVSIAVRYYESPSDCMLTLAHRESPSLLEHCLCQQSSPDTTLAFAFSTAAVFATCQLAISYCETMCGGFTCTRNALKALNLLYIVLAFLFIASATYLKAVGQISDKPLIGGLVASGVFLFLLALLGLVGTAKHHQVMLFFYMVILFLLFVVQSSIGCYLLSFSEQQQRELAQSNWNSSSIEERQRNQKKFDCCAFRDDHPKSSILCPNVRCCQLGQCSQCGSCETKIQQAIGEIFFITGCLALLLSLTEFLGVWLTVRFRNQKNPRANPNAFL